MKKQTMMLMLITTLLIPTLAMAMNHGKAMDPSAMDHSSMEKMDHSKMDHGGGMAMGGEMIMLQDVEVDGVMASGHMLDTREKMAKHGMQETHHFMVSFMDSSGEPLSEGQVALKIEAPDGSVSQAIRLMGMGGAFGADITLDKKGTYKFMVGTKLNDGKKRMFHMHYDNS